MSYEKTKTITINEKNGTVFITSASNNCFPITYRKWQCRYLEDMMKEHGREAVDSYILEQYNGGMMQGGVNEYNQTLQVFKYGTLDNLEKLRKMKKDSRGKKFIVATESGDMFLFNNKRLTLNKEKAATFTQIEAIIKARRYHGLQALEA